MASASATIQAFNAKIQDLGWQVASATPRVVALSSATEALGAASQNAAAPAAATAQAVGNQASAMQRVTSAANGATGALNTATGAVNSHRAATEAMVLVHEAMSGRFSRMGGSLMILTQQLGGASLAMMGLAGAMGVAAMAALHLTEWLGKVHDAKLLAEAGGLGSGISQQQADAYVSTLRSMSGVSTEEAGKIANAYLQMRGVTAPIMEELTRVTREYALRAGEDNTAAAQKIAAAFNMEASAATEVMEKTRASAETTKALQDAITNNRPIEARSILLRELSRSALQVDTETRKAVRTSEDLSRSMAAAQGAGMAPGSAAGALLRTPVVDTDSIAAAARLKAALASVNDEMKAPAAVSWSEQQRTALQAATLATVEAGRKQGETWRQINQDKLAAEVNFWRQAIQQTRDGSKEQEEAKRSLYAAEEQLDMLRQKTGEADGKKAVEAYVASLSAQQAAAGEDFAKVMALEQQKLSALKAAYGENSKNYQEELKHQEELTKQHYDKLASQSMEALAKQREIDQSAYGERKANLDAEVSDHLITKQAEIADLLAYADQKYQIEHQSLTDLIATLDAGTAAYRKAMDERTLLDQQHAKTVAALNAQMAQADRQTAQQSEREYTQAFSSIATSGERAISGLIVGTTTWQRAELSVANSVAQQFIALTTKMVEQWAATEVAKTFATNSGVAQRVAAEQAEGATGWSAILARWIGLEQSKTAATTTGAGVRATSDSGGSFLSAIGAILARWLGLEAAKTAATDVGAGERAFADGAAAIAGAKVLSAYARLAIMSEAAIAAAAAFADSASLGPAGLAAAPGASAAAYSSVMAFQTVVPSFAVGAWSLPSDMMANIHAGEMIVPAFEAGQFRNAIAALNGGGGAGASPTNVNITLQAIDTQSGVAFLRSHSPAIAQMVSAQMSRNPSVRPNY